MRDRECRFMEFRMDDQTDEERHYIVKGYASTYEPYHMMTSDDGTEYFKEHQDDADMKLFLANRILRPSCHRCKAKAEHRVSDITLGDFWGLQGEKSEKGCSVADRKSTRLNSSHL